MHHGVAVSAFGDHNDGYSLEGRGNFYPDFAVGCDRYWKDMQSGGLRCLIHLEAVGGYYNLDHLDHWERYWFRLYFMQALRGLAAGPAGPFDPHRKCIDHSHRLCVSLMLNSVDMDKVAQQPDHFMLGKVYSEEDLNLTSVMYRPKDDEANFAKVQQWHRQTIRRLVLGL